MPSEQFALMRLNRIELDRKTAAEREWQQRKLAPAPQQPCDHGLFSDDRNQTDLLDMLTHDKKA